MKSVHFLSVEQVILIHQRMINEFGGSGTVRDHGLLESAVLMPCAKFSGEYLHNNIPAMAAAYLFHLCKNHAFLDGNKRTAVATSEVFLQLNQMKMTATDEMLEELILGVAKGTISKADVISFFSKFSRPS